LATLALETPAVKFGRILLEYPEHGWVHIESLHPANERRHGPLLVAERGRFKTRYTVVENF
jgi:hypothetical protein